MAQGEDGPFIFGSVNPRRRLVVAFFCFRLVDNELGDEHHFRVISWAPGGDKGSVPFRAVP